MKDSEVIAELTRENLENKKTLRSYKETMEWINSKIFCIGGPLNDNVMGYTNRQLRIFSDIATAIRGEIE